MISNRRIGNGYSTFIHERRPGIEKMANKGFAGFVSSNVQTPVISKKSNKRGKEATLVEGRINHQIK